ncbi:MAG: phosphoribosylaminoimidazolesuccinocarboxamide synthase [bacterium]|nr:phosphoribosylaminoimidazolesuccinocarboxamide synthase [bacterium]
METKRIGSTKIITPVERGVIEFKYTDRWSAFDRGASKQTIPGIGAARCACAVKSFERINNAGLSTHFLKQVSPDAIHVLEFAVPGHEPLSGKVHGQVLDAEWIRRVLAYGSMLDRLKAGTATPEQFGFAPGTVVTEGMKLPRMFRECTTKFEPTDRHLTDVETRERLGINEAEWEEAWNLIEDVAGVIGSSYEGAGFILPDGKNELARMLDGSFVVVDVTGLQDEDRIIDAKTGLLYSKDIIRNHLRQTDWYPAFLAAKAAHPTDKSKWPPYPMLPDGVVEFVSKQYAEVARRYAGVRI